MPLKVSEAYSGSWLKAVDLRGRHAKVTIEQVKMEKVGDDSKMVCYFLGKEKGLVLNKTNAMVIADTLGDDAELWNGREIELRPERVTFQGKMVDAIRVSVPIDQETSQAAAQPVTRPAAEPGPRTHLGVPEGDLDDIPF